MSDPTNDLKLHHLEPARRAATSPWWRRKLGEASSSVRERAPQSAARSAVRRALKSSLKSSPCVLLAATPLLLSGCNTAPSQADQGDHTPKHVSEASGERLLRVAVLPAIETDEFRQRSVYRGQVEARRRSEVAFDLAGTLTQVRVEEGDRVEAGQTLARLDVSRLEARERQLLAAQAEAETGLALAQSTLERIERAASRSAVSPQDVDEAQRARDAAAAVVDRVSAELELVRVDQRKSRLTAPYRAVVAQRMADEGQVVAPGTPVLALLEIERPRVRVGLPIDVAASLEEIGEDLQVEIAGQRSTAKRLALLPEQDARTRTVDVLLELNEPLGRLRVGQAATLELERDVARSGFELPLSALTEASRGLWSAYVAVPSDSDSDAVDVHVVEQRPVEVVELQNEEQGTRALVRGALSNGDLVVHEGLQRLVPGQRVIVTTAGARS